MGGTNAKELLEKNQYQQVGKVSPDDQVYLGGRLYRSQVDGRMVVVVTRMYENKAQMLQAKALCADRPTREGEVQLLRYQDDSTTDACSAIYKMQAVYEYYPDTLHKDYQKRLRESRSYSEGELFYLAQRLLKVSTFCDHIMPSEVVITPQGELKCFSSPLQKQRSTLYQRLLTAEKSDQIYLSPKQLEGLKRHAAHPRDDPLKTKVFIIGLVLIQLAMMQSVVDVYDYDHFCMRSDLIDTLLQDMAQRYSPWLTYLIQCMLHPDEQHRHSPQEILEVLQVAQQDGKVQIGQSLLINSLPKMQVPTEQVPLQNNMAYTPIRHENTAFTYHSPPSQPISQQLPIQTFQAEVPVARPQVITQSINQPSLQMSAQPAPIDHVPKVDTKLLSRNYRMSSTGINSNFDQQIQQLRERQQRVLNNVPSDQPTYQSPYKPAYPTYHQPTPYQRESSPNRYRTPTNQYQYNYHADLNKTNKPLIHPYQPGSLPGPPYPRFR